MSATITDPQLRAQKLGRLSPHDQQGQGGVQEVLSVAFVVAAGLPEPVQIGLQCAPAGGEPHDGLARILVTVDGREVQLSKDLAKKQGLRVELRVVHLPPA